MLGIVSCDMVTLTGEPTAVETTTTIGGYPHIQALINASIDEALAVVDAAAERSVEPDPRYVTLSRALRRERDGDWATERVLDPGRPADELTEAERDEVDSLIADDPELDAAFAGLADELEVVYASIPTISIKVQDLDENNDPIGEPYTIQSENGVIEFGDRTVASEEFLLWIQSHDAGPERGFVIDRDWYHSDFGSGRAWPNDRVRYFFDSSITATDRSWMWWKLHRTQHATSVRFTEYSNTSSRRYAWNRGSSPYLRISRAELGTTPGTATLGKVSKSFLKMDHGTGRTETGENQFYHEVGHVLGLIHEHQRYDRDNHVIMSPYKAYYDANYTRIKQRRRQQFWFLWWSWYSWVDNSTTYGTPYDYHSITHYPADRSTTIHRADGGGYWDANWRNKGVWGAENNYTYFTPWDIYTIKRRYGITPNPRPGYTPRPAYPSS